MKTVGEGTAVNPRHNPGVRELGSNIVVAIDQLDATGVSVVERAVDGGRHFALSGPHWRSTVDVIPARWLGLEFVIHDDSDTRLIVHQIDTDLYPIGEPAQRDFAEEIETDIVEFLEALRAGTISMRRRGPGPGSAMVVPVGGGFYRIAQGWIMASGRTFADQSQAEAGGGYEQLVG